MLTQFFYQLRAQQLPVSLTEFLALLEGLEQHVAGFSVDDFYYFARVSLVKDERHFDRFDRAFDAYYRGAEQSFQGLLPDGELPEEWLRAQAELSLSEEEKAQIEALGGWEELMRTLSERLAEQRERHQGGNKWIGSGGRSPFGNAGYHPEGVRIGGQSRHRRAVKVWERREFKNFDGDQGLGTRNIKIALRKLRRFAREGAPDQLDLDGTISATARNAGLLDLQLRPERRNAVKVLLFLDVGGSMDDHVNAVQQLFSAARSEFKHLEYFYFHNCVYESVWRDNRRRHNERTPLPEVLRSYGPDYRLVLVGDAHMSPYEITQPGGSVEHLNREPGALWLQRLLDGYPHAVWLNPMAPEHWDYSQSITMIKELMAEQMFALSLDGLEAAMTALKRRRAGA